MTTRETHRTAIVEVWGGFHNAPVIRLRVRCEELPDHWMESAAWLADPGVLTDHQARRLRRHMCGIEGCLCGLHHGAKYAILD